jgi:hypothetical protein
VDTLQHTPIDRKKGRRRSTKKKAKNAKQKAKLHNGTGFSSVLDKPSIV